MFEVDDFESQWLYAYPFDFIHGRELAGSVRDYDRLFAQALQNLKPGGYLEMQTFNPDVDCDDDTIEKATYTREWISNLHEASKRFGKSLIEAHTWKDKMVNAGFVDVTCRVFKVWKATLPPVTREL
jgi:trans-aconitate methyltransferase